MKKRPLLGVLVAIVALACAAVMTALFRRDATPGRGFTGSQSCRRCHTVFYQKWSTSHHGLAMQPYSDAFARTNLMPQTAAVRIGDKAYRYLSERGVVRETGPAGARDHPVAHIMGGKNVYYLLTPLERGKLQALPVGYDVRKKIWYDVPGSAVEHFGGRADLALDWTDRLYTFNTACSGCHVSQTATRYDLASDTYRTTWTEPGINCETCHGPGAEHIRVCAAAPTNKPPKDLKIIVTKTMTHAQRNDLCAPCHARMLPLTGTFTPGDRYFDHFDLVGLEHADFYPDGRDFGENYTMTGWLLSPCARAGKLDCVHCHTSSGRYRFAAAAEANKACLPCHEARVEASSAHTRHAAGTKADECVSCHMPTTSLAGMRRSDHSMRPPMPEAALKFGSPIACLNCHTNSTPAWTLEMIRKWYPSRDYPLPTLHWAGLIEAARRDDWSRLPEMMAYVGRTNREEVVAAGLLRLSASCPDPAKWPVLRQVLSADPAPLVRAAAVEALAEDPASDRATRLLRATRDEYRLVRVRAAMALAGLPRTGLVGPDRAALDQATAELETALRLRPDDAGTYYNLGNYHMARQALTNAADAYAQSLRLRSDFLPALVNLALLRNTLGQNDEAERLLRGAADAAPSNAAVFLNLGLLLGEMDKPDEAEAAFQKTIQCDPSNAVAAYNLSVIAGRTSVADAVRWSSKAAEWNPREPRYAYTHAYYLAAGTNLAAATGVLRTLVREHPAFESGWLLLTDELLKAGDRAAAAESCRRALEVSTLSLPARAELDSRLKAIEQPREP